MATEFTPHYNLDKYTSTDKPNLRDQYNAAMDKIDLALLSANTNATEAKSATQSFQEQLNAKAEKTKVAEDIASAVAPLATKTELNNAIAPLATKTELNNAVAPLATKTELNNAVSTLKSKIVFTSENPNVDNLRNCVLCVNSDVNYNNVIVDKSVILQPYGGIISGTITINGYIANIPMQIFATNANVTARNQKVGMPEWFGAKTNNSSVDCSTAINKTIKTFPVTELQEAEYYISNSIEIKDSNRFIYCNGIPSSSTGTTNEGGCRLITNKSIKAVVIDNTSTAYSQTQVHIENIGVCATVSASRGIEINTCRAVYLTNVIVSGFTTGVYTYGAVNHYYNRVRVFLVNSGVNGFYFDTNAPTYPASISPLSTVMIQESEVNNISGASVNCGISAAGNGGVADLNISTTNFIACTRGLRLEGNTTNKTQQDVTINECIIDNCIDAIYITGGISAMIADNWISVGAYGEGTRHSVWFEDNGNSPCTVVGNHIKQAQATAIKSYGLRIVASNNISFIGNAVFNFTNGEVVQITNSNGCILESTFANNLKDTELQMVRLETCKYCTIKPTLYGSNKYAYGVVTQSATNCTIDFSGIASECITAAKVRMDGTNATAAMCFNATQASKMALIGVL